MRAYIVGITAGCTSTTTNTWATKPSSRMAWTVAASYRPRSGRRLTVARGEGAVCTGTSLLQYEVMSVRTRYQLAGRTAIEIAASVETAIRHQSLGPGEQLPPVRTLARELSVSPATVASAYRHLRTRGIIVGDGRRGTRVAARPPLLARPPAAPP